MRRLHDIFSSDLVSRSIFSFEVIIERFIFDRLQRLSGNPAKFFCISCLDAFNDLGMEFYSLFRSFLGYGKGKCGVQDVFGNITDFDNKWISRNLIHLHMKLDIILFVFIDIPMITMLMHLACQPLKNLDIRITGSLDHCSIIPTSIILRYSNTDLTSSLSIISIGVMDFR